MGWRTQVTYDSRGRKSCQNGSVRHVLGSFQPQSGLAENRLRLSDEAFEGRVALPVIGKGRNVPPTASAMLQNPLVNPQKPAVFPETLGVVCRGPHEPILGSDVHADQIRDSGYERGPAAVHAEDANYRGVHRDDLSRDSESDGAATHAPRSATDREAGARKSNTAIRSLLTSGRARCFRCSKKPG